MIIKHSYNGYSIETGTKEVDEQMGDQLRVTADEITRALNAHPEHLSDVFARILLNRRADQDRLLSMTSK